MLDYRYKTFLTLIEEGSYTKTAQKLNITQPAVTQHIQHLQEELGVRLFRYEGKQLLVTEKGRYLEEQLSLLNRDVERIRTHLLQQDDAPTLSFGATLTIGEYVMPGLIGRYLEQYPRHHFVDDRRQYGHADWFDPEGENRFRADRRRLQPEPTRFRKAVR